MGGHAGDGECARACMHESVHEGVVTCVYVCLHVMDQSQGMGKGVGEMGRTVHRKGVNGAGEGVGGRGGQ